MPENHPYSIFFIERVRGYFLLTKPRLSFLVAFSSAFGFLLASKASSFDLFPLMMLSVGGFLVSASGAVINQIIEIKFDAKMKRTRSRPLVTGLVSKREAEYYSVLLGTLGIVILVIHTNWITAVLAFFSLMMYSFAYTYLKRIGPIAVFIGAIPGAMPPLLGWTAYANEITLMSLVVFGIQYIWQFPHFWAIAWISDDDYRLAGFKLLPGNGKQDLNTAIQIMSYTLLLIPMGLLPTKLGITGFLSAFCATLLGVMFLMQTFYLMRTRTKNAALKTMLSSIVYLPLVQIIYIFDKV